ncbi:MAG: shikimate dehydrogenase [Clostridia bacterium]|nr:shikimate dehydrogenase [Clostridia bacterium]
MMEYGLIGEKLGHSFSKTVHNKLADYEYELLEIKPQDLEEFIRIKNFKAINVTIPYKELVIPYLDEIDDVAKKIGAVNTVVNRNGKLYGFNTDFFGLSGLIEYNGITLSSKKVLILGSGGTSKTAYAVAESLNAREICVVSRKGGNGFITYEEAYKNHKDAEIIINTTPCGMYPNNQSMAIDINCFNKLNAVIDVIYNPIKTALVIEAEKRGITAIGGLYMLISQAVFAAEKFLSSQIEKEKTENIFKEILKEKQNIVLIGMPSCGKSTIGKMLSEKSGKTFVDTDEEIVKLSKMAIPEIFEKYGENHFRDLESEVIKEVSKKQETIIATGGGAILRQENIDLLKQNSILFFIDRPLEFLESTADRPLSSNREMLEKRYNERYEKYVSAADKIIKVSNDLEENLSLIKEGFFE